MAINTNGYVTIPSIWTELNGLTIHTLSGTTGVVELTDVGSAYAISISRETDGFGSTGMAIYYGDKPTSETILGAEIMYLGEFAMIEKYNEDKIWVKGVSKQLKLTVRKVK